MARKRLPASGLVARLVALVVIGGGLTARAERVIPPGREPLLVKLAGGHPGPCACSGITVDHERVRATYDCPEGRFALSLGPPEGTDEDRQGATDAGVTAIGRTREFLIVADGASPPASLREALLAQVRAGEAAWSWGEPHRDVVDVAYAALPIARPPGAWRITLGAALAALLLGLGLHRTLRRAVTDPGARPRRLSSLAAAVGSGACAWLFIHLTDSPPIMGADTARDLLMAMDCLREHRCTVGAPAFFGGAVQGSAWYRLLALRQEHGLSLGGFEELLRAGRAAAVALLVFTVRHRLRHPGWAATGALLLAFTPLLVAVPLLACPSPLPCLLTLAFTAQVETLLASPGPGASRSASARSFAWAVTAGAALGVAADLHIVLATAVPLQIAALVAGGAPVPSVVAATLASLLLPALASPETWRDNLSLLPGPLAVALALALALLLALAAWLRRRTRLLAPAHRLPLVVSLLATASALVPVAIHAVRPTGWGWHYLAPSLATLPLLAMAPPALLLEALCTALPPLRRRWLAAPILFVAAVGLVWPWRDRLLPRASGWLVPDVERLAGVLVGEQGLRFADLRARLAASEPLLVMLAPFDPLPAGVPTPGPRIVPVREPPGSPLRAGDDPVPLLDGGFVRLLRVADPVVDRSRGSVCYLPVSAAESCVDYTLGAWREGRFIDRTDLALASVRRQVTEARIRSWGGYRVRYAQPLLPRAEGAAIHLYPADREPIELEVTGVPGAERLADGSYLLRGPIGPGATLRATQTIPAGDEWLDRAWPPAIAEEPAP